MTPEGIVKAAVNKVLGGYGHHVYRFMPVPTGFGKKTLDYLVCAWGTFVSIETKAPGKKPTNLQNVAIKQIRDAGGVVFVIDRAEHVGTLKEYLDDLAVRHHQHTSSGGGGPQD